MDHKTDKTSLVIAFDPSGSLQRLSVPILNSAEEMDIDTPIDGSEAMQTDSEVSYHATQINGMLSWLTLRAEATHELEAVESSVSRPLNSLSIGDAPEFFRMSPKKMQQLLRSAPARRSRQSPIRWSHADSGRKGPSKWVVFHIGVDRSPSITWATFYCSQILNGKLATVIKIEHSKAVASTLGGAYATLQRSGWARHYARQQLAIARLSGDERLELRAFVYLEICKIISITFPKFAARKVYQEDEDHVTTRTDTNATAADAKAISPEQREQLNAELEVLMEKAKKSENEEIVGLVKYAAHRVKNA